jgi:hypothetical protein
LGSYNASRAAFSKSWPPVKLRTDPDAVLDGPVRLKRMQEAAQSMARPNAAADIADDALALVN